MANRTEELKLIISGDGRLLGTELQRSENQIRNFGSRTAGIFGNIEKRIGGTFKRMLTNPLTLFGGSAAILYAGKQLIDYQDALSTLRINAGRTAEDQLKLSQAIQTTAIATGQSRDAILAAVTDIIDKTGDYDYAVASFVDLSRATTAMTADFSDTGRLASALRLNLNATADDVGYLMDVIATQGNVGSFVFKDLAAQSERLISSASILGINKSNFAEYGAFLQKVRPSFGSAEETSTAVKNIAMRLVTEKKKVEKLVGFKIFDEKGNVKDFSRTIKAIVTKSGGDMAKLDKLFGEGAIAFSGLVKEYKQLGNMDSFDKMVSSGREAGFITGAFGVKAGEAKFQLNALAQVGKEFADTALAGVLKDMTTYLTELTSDPARLKAFREEIGRIAEDLGLIAKGLFTIVTLPGDMMGKSVRSRLTKQASDELRSMPKEEQKKVRSMVRGGTGLFGSGAWETGLYSSLQRYKQEKAAANVTTVNVTVNEGGKVLAETQSTNGQSRTAVKTNRGAFR